MKRRQQVYRVGDLQGLDVRPDRRPAQLAETRQPAVVDLPAAPAEQQPEQGQNGFSGVRRVGKTPLANRKRTLHMDRPSVNHGYHSGAQRANAEELDPWSECFAGRRRRDQPPTPTTLITASVTIGTSTMARTPIRRPYRIIWVMGMRPEA